MLSELEKLLDLRADFVEIRGAFSRGSAVTVKNGEVDRATSGSLSLFSVRVLNNKSFGFASSNDIKDLSKITKDALKLSKVSSKRSLEVELSEEKPVNDSVNIKPKKDPANFSLEQKTKDLLEINKEMKIGRKILGYETRLSDTFTDWYYLNSEGSRIKYSYTSSRLGFLSLAKGKAIQTVQRGFGGIYGYEILDMHRDKAITVSESAITLSNSSPPKSGVYDVILGPKMTGVFSHEAVGHACEADSVVSGESILKDKIEKRIASDKVSIYDDPTFSKAFGYYPYDDEGVKTRKTQLLENGILSGFLHSRETAGRLEAKSTGNARAQSVGHFPIVRMSNEHFEPGDFSLEELKDMKLGIYVEGMKGGQTDIAAGNYQFAAEEGYLIENGEMKEPLRDIVIFGDILETLRNVDAVGKDMKYNNIGTCGKSGQGVPVSAGGPNIRVRGVRVGGA